MISGLSQHTENCGHTMRRAVFEPPPTDPCVRAPYAAWPPGSALPQISCMRRKKQYETGISMAGWEGH